MCRSFDPLYEEIENFSTLYFQENTQNFSHKGNPFVVIKNDPLPYLVISFPFSSGFFIRPVQMSQMSCPNLAMVQCTATEPRVDSSALRCCAQSAASTPQPHTMLLHSGCFPYNKGNMRNCGNLCVCDKDIMAVLAI